MTAKITGNALEQRSRTNSVLRQGRSQLQKIRLSMKTVE